MHDIADNKAPGGPTSLTPGLTASFHGYEDPPGLHDKVRLRLSIVVDVMNQMDPLRMWALVPHNIDPFNNDVICGKAVKSVCSSSLSINALRA